MRIAKEARARAAKAETVTVENGKVTIGVNVKMSSDITAPAADWETAQETTLTIPVASQQGFMILQSSDAKIK